MKEIFEKDICPCSYIEEDPFDGMEIGNLLFGNSRGSFRLERHPAQEIFGKFFEAVKVDSYGYAEEDSPLKAFEKETEEYYIIDTPLFSIMPYYWGYNEEVMELPNFVYKPEGIEIQWYKYPMRDAYSSVPLDEKRLKEILDKCAGSIKGVLK